MPIKVKATYPKETEVTLKMDLRSAELLREVMNGIDIRVTYEQTVDSTEYTEDEVSELVLSIIDGLDGEVA